MRKLILILFSLNATAGGPFSPPASVSGSTAISKDSEKIISWSTGGYIESSGYMNIERKDLGFASMGDISNTFGKSDGSTWSLGDSGVVVLTFDNYISDNDGYDLAVFENSFSETFLRGYLTRKDSLSFKSFLYFLKSTHSSSISFHRI